MRFEPSATMKRISGSSPVNDRIPFGMASVSNGISQVPYLRARAVGVKPKPRSPLKAR